jgi:ribosomal protein S18 acetylase RimI-like enzyme
MTHQGPAISIAALDSTAIADRDLEDLLKLVYVGGGFTEPSLADSLFVGASVRARGHVLVAKDRHAHLLGSVVVVRPESPAARFAVSGEAELHLLCVRPDQQGRGIGSALVSAAIEDARSGGAARMILWTQSSMAVAKALYRRFGFSRLPSLDFARGERTFQVFARPI